VIAGPTHADLHRDIGGLKVDVANVKKDVEETKASVKEGFANIEEKLQTLLDERQQRIGVKKLVGILHAAGGGTLALVGQWTAKKLGLL